jgi:hypothetical protein
MRKETREDSGATMKEEKKQIWTRTEGWLVGCYENQMACAASAATVLVVSGQGRGTGAVPQGPHWMTGTGPLAETTDSQGEQNGWPSP